MSSIPEALCARLLGMHVIGLSVVTNLAAGLSKETLDHADVKLVSDAVSTAVYALIGALIARVNIPRLPLLSRYTPRSGIHRLSRLPSPFPAQKTLKRF